MKVQGNKVLAQKMGDILTRGGINISAITVLGTYVHIDTYKKYETDLFHFLCSTGWQILSADTCRHLDEYNGYRVSTKLKT